MGQGFVLTLVVLAGGGAGRTSPVGWTSVPGNSRLTHVASHSERQRTTTRACVRARAPYTRCAWVDAGMAETYENLPRNIRFCRNKLWVLYDMFAYAGL